MPATNVIGPIDQDTWRGLVHLRGALSVFKQDTVKYEIGIQKYTDIYKDTLSAILL